MDRLTVKSTVCPGHYSLKCLRNKNCDNGVLSKEYDCAKYCNMGGLCDDCEIQQAFDKLAAYEATGLTPEQINDLIKEEALWKIKSFT